MYSATTMKRDDITEIVVAKVYKANEEQPLGIQLKKNGGTIVVNGVSSTGLFEGTGLDVGMKIQSINGFDMTRESMDMATLLLKTCVGEVVVVAEKSPSHESSNQASKSALGTTTTATLITPTLPDNMIVVKILRRSQEEPLGIRLVQSQHRGSMNVLAIDSTGPFANTALEVGMQIKSINGVSVTGKSMDLAILLLKESVGEVDVAAAKVPGGLVTNVASPDDGLASNRVAPPPERSVAVTPGHNYTGQKHVHVGTVNTTTTSPAVENPRYVHFRTRNPATLNYCPRCGKEHVVTQTKTKTTGATWLGCLVGFFIFWPICWIPFVCNPMKQTNHYCPSCRSKLGRVKAFQ